MPPRACGWPTSRPRAPAICWSSPRSATVPTTRAGSRRCRAAIYGGDEMPAAGVPAFRGRDTVLDRPPNNAATLHTMRPGAYGHADPVTGGAYTVVWWDPLLLDRRGAERRGLRNEHLIGKDAPAEVVAADRAAYERWRQWRSDTIAGGSRPSLQVMTATQWAHATMDGDGGIAGGDRDDRAARCESSTPACSIRIGRPAPASASWSTPCSRTCRSTPPSIRSRTWRRCRPGCSAPATPSAPPRRRWSIAPCGTRCWSARGPRRPPAAPAGARSRWAWSSTEWWWTGRPTCCSTTATRWLVVDFKTDVEITGAKPSTSGRWRSTSTPRSA